MFTISVCSASFTKPRSGRGKLPPGRCRGSLQVGRARPALVSEFCWALTAGVWRAAARPGLSSSFKFAGSSESIPASDLPRAVACPGQRPGQENEGGGFGRAVRRCCADRRPGMLCHCRARLRRLSALESSVCKSQWLRLLGSLERVHRVWAARIQKGLQCRRTRAAPGSGA